jgi:hypothetical protein
MKRLTVLIFCSLAFLALSNPSKSSAIGFTSGPVGINGLRAYSGPGVGQITFDWSRVSLTGENYTIRCGTVSGFYPFVYSHVGYIATYTAYNLVPGQRYYCVLERIQIGDVSIGWSGEVSALAATGVSSPAVPSGPVGRNQLTATAIGGGKVVLKWKQFFSDTTSWHLVFGTKPGQFEWGALNIVNTAPGVTDYSYTVNLLTPGQRVYFALVPVRSGVAFYITAEVSVVVE